MKRGPGQDTSKPPAGGSCGAVCPDCASPARILQGVPLPAPSLCSGLVADPSSDCISLHLLPSTPLVGWATIFPCPTSCLPHLLNC